MRRLLLISVWTLAGTISYGQNEPSMEVTYAYLNKKAQEANGHYRYIASADNNTQKGKYIYSDISIAHLEKTGEMQIKYHRDAASAGFDSDDYTFEFNPKHIKTIELTKRDQTSPVGVVLIRLSGMAGKMLARYPNGERNLESTDEMIFPFLQTDVENFSKNKKALEHLKKLAAEAEFDPFGN